MSEAPPRSSLPPSAPRLADALAAVRRESLDPGDEWQGERVEGDLSDQVADHVEITGCELRGVRLTGARLDGLRLVDVLGVDCELSGALVGEATWQRVELVNCRMTGVVVSDAKLRHVRFRDCKLDDANFRFATGARVIFDGCSLVEADFAGAVFSESAFTGCDLRRAEFSKASMKGTRFARSTLEGLRGAGSLRGAIVGTDQVLPLALGVFADLGISISDESESEA